MSVKSKTKGGLDTGTEGLRVSESQNTSVVDLGFDEGGRVKIGLGADFQRNARSGGLCVIDRLSSGFDIGADSVVVAGSKGVEVVETVDSHGVFWCIVTDSSGVAGDLSISDIVRSLSTKEETIATEDGVSSESGTLEHVEGAASVDTRLLVDDVEQSRFVSSVGCQRGGKVKFQSLCKVVLEFELGLENVGSCPGFGEDKAILVVRVLGFDITGDGLRLGVPQTSDLEGNIGGSLGLDFQGSSEDGIVLGQQVIGRLSKVLP